MFMFKETGITGLKVRTDKSDIRYTLEVGNTDAVASLNYISLILSYF